MIYFSFETREENVVDGMWVKKVFKGGKILNRNWGQTYFFLVRKIWEKVTMSRTCLLKTNESIFCDQFTVKVLRFWNVIYLFIYLFIFLQCGLQELFLNHGSNPFPLLWNQGGLTTGQPRKSHWYVIFRSLHFVQFCIKDLQEKDSFDSFRIFHRKARR